MAKDDNAVALRVAHKLLGTAADYDIWVGEPRVAAMCLNCRHTRIHDYDPDASARSEWFTGKECRNRECECQNYRPLEVGPRRREKRKQEARR